MAVGWLAVGAVVRSPVVRRGAQLVVELLLQLPVELFVGLLDARSRGRRLPC